MSLLKRIGGSQPQPTSDTAAPVSAPAPSSAADHTPVPRTGQSTITAGSEMSQQRMLELSLWIVDRILSSLGNQQELKRSPEMERQLQEKFTLAYRQSGVNLTDDQTKQLYDMVMDELFGFGPIEPLLRDDSITEVMVNGPRAVYVEQKGKITLTQVRFANDEHVLKVIDRIIRPLGRRIDRKWPMVDARLPDGSRVNAIIPPCAIDGPSITIESFAKKN